MSVPEGVSEKLRRANEHLEALNVSVERFLERDSNRVISEDDPDTGNRIYRAEILESPPSVKWAVVAGDILHNLRSGLDHLAYALCTVHAPGKTPPGRTEFPIFWDKDRFENIEARGGLYKIRGMSCEMKNAIRAEQPYNRGNPAKAQSIWLLQELSNIDKHRVLNLAVVAQPAMTFWVSPGVEFELGDMKQSLVVAVGRPIPPQTKVQNDPDFTFRIAFDEGPAEQRDFVVQLGTFCRITGEIVERLAERFLG